MIKYRYGYSKYSYSGWLTGSDIHSVFTHLQLKPSVIVTM